MVTLDPRLRRATVAMAFSAAVLATPNLLTGQGVRGGADSVRVRLAGIERLAPQDGEDAAALIEIRVAIDHAAGFHSWPDEPVVPPELKGLAPIATSIEVVSAPEGVETESVDWPDPVRITVRYTSEPLELLSFTDTTVALLRARLPAIQDGESNRAAESPDDRIELQVRFQSCDEEYCYPPRRESLSIPLRR